MEKSTSWVADEALVREINEQFMSAIASYEAKPTLITEHANHEESIRTGGYAQRTLLELAQNAADAIVSAGDTGQIDVGKIEIVLDPASRSLYVANSGLPFTEDGLVTITHAFLSAKRGDEIGRFGLGFKSVLAVTTSPQVISRSVSFGFNSPQARQAMAGIAAVENFPVLRTPNVLDGPREIAQDPILAELAGWASTIVKLPNVSNMERLRLEIEDFSSEFLLFVGSVREVKLRVVGPDSFETSHFSKDLGNGQLRIERPNGEGMNWFVKSRMHVPSVDARKLVGEAVSREEVKVTVAVPVEHSKLRIGEFWSYFRLQDTTSASALFNAPWSVNDDRTTLLKNDYNREILKSLAEIFVELLPSAKTGEDPAAHLDFMPARGRGQESHGFGDDILAAHVLRMASLGHYIPDAKGVLRNGSDLRPLDSSIRFDSQVHQGWIQSPNTGNDVPHWRCYSSPTRASRLRDLLISAIDADWEPSARDARTALETMPKRGLLSWLREWAEGDDPKSSANAFRTVTKNLSLAEIRLSKVVPTTDGMRALADSAVVFLHRDEDLDVEGGVFVTPGFLAEAGIERLLREHGFRDLDPESILNARLVTLPITPSDEDLVKLWDAALSVPVPAAGKMMALSQASIKVPTRDGSWAWPQQVFDLDITLSDDVAASLLDRSRCVPDVAHQIGVIQKPVKDFALEDEPKFAAFVDATLRDLNARMGPGDLPVKAIDLSTADGPGPFSVLFMLRDADAPSQVRANWTSTLLSLGDRELIVEETDSSRSFTATSPLRWAVDQVGLLETTRGYRRVSDVVAPSLVRFAGLLPLYRGPQQALSSLDLPADLGDVPGRVLREMLEGDTFPRVDDETLAQFILTACEFGFDGTRPATIPARIKQMVEAHEPSAVYLATTDEQEEFLRSRQRPYLRVKLEDVNAMVEVVGCRRFEDSFSFSMVIEGVQESQRILDVYTGLRQVFGVRLRNCGVSRAIQIAKRVTTEGGVEDQPLDWHLDGSELVVRSDADAARILNFINEAFTLRLDNSQLSAVLQAGLDHRLELLRQEAKTIESDAERLDLYIGPDDLRDALPSGLWTALEAQSLVDDETSVADLFVTVYGSDSLIMLADRFREEGFGDVPSAWAGTPAAMSWVRKMGFGPEFAGQRSQKRPQEFVVPGAIHLNRLHTYQKKISEDLRTVLTQKSEYGPAQKGMVELPTGAGKTRVATETVLRLFLDEVLSGTVLWIAQSAELCEQAVQTFESVWRYLGDERPLTIGRLWDTNTVREPETGLSIIVATDAKIEAIMDRPDYEWLSQPAAVFIDEAHRAGGSTRYTAILRWLGVDGRSWERPLVGLSATPFKGRAGDDQATKDLVARFGSKRLTAFDSDAYQELVKLGVLASVRHEVLPSGIEVELSNVERDTIQSRRLIDRSVYEQIGRNEERMRVLVEHIMKQDPEWPILVFTPSVLSAQVLAASLRYRGVEAASVSGQTGRQERRNVIRKFKEGEIKVLANCDLLVQGFDAPGVRALYIARPTFSPGAYIQMAGRGLRGKENGGKEECLIVDVSDNWGAMNDFLGYHEYADLWTEQR